MDQSTCKHKTASVKAALTWEMLSRCLRELTLRDTMSCMKLKQLLLLLLLLCQP